MKMKILRSVVREVLALNPQAYHRLTVIEATTIHGCYLMLREVEFGSSTLLGNVIRIYIGCIFATTVI